MCGKFLKCFTLLILELVLSSLIWAENITEGGDGIYVNGYFLTQMEKDQIIGMRFKGMGDWLIRKNAYSSAIKYYENAIKYLPNEADIYYNLGVIYYSEKLYDMAAEYYKIAAQKYQLPENAGKGMERYYLALVWQAMSLKKLDKDREAEILTWQLEAQETEIRFNYPQVYKKLIMLYNVIWKYGKPKKY